MAELVQLILELSNSVMEILTISIVGICILNNLNLQVGDTVVLIEAMTLDCIIIPKATLKVIIDRLFQVFIDTIENSRTCRDTIIHPFGTIKRKELVMGGSPKQDLNIYFVIPEDLKVFNISKTTTQILRSPLLVFKGGFIYNPSKPTLASNIGFFWVLPNNHKFVGWEFGYDRTVNFKVGLRFGI